MERPKQRRHRCKDPTKLDINSLTGEERVPVVHRGTGRRVDNTHTHTHESHECAKPPSSTQHPQVTDIVPSLPALQLGGAMAPAIKELSRWLDANSEYYVAPDWADVVKHSVSINVLMSSMTCCRQEHQPV